MLHQASCIVSKLLVNTICSYSLETPNSGQNQLFFFLCDLEIWRMTLKNNRAPLLCYFKLCASFHNHWWIQTGVTVRKHSNLAKIGEFFVLFDLEIWRMTLQNNRALRLPPEIAKLGLDFCDLDLWPQTFAWTSLLTIVIIPENFTIIHKKVWRTDRQTDWTIHRVACLLLKSFENLVYRCLTVLI